MNKQPMSTQMAKTWTSIRTPILALIVSISAGAILIIFSDANFLEVSKITLANLTPTGIFFFTFAVIFLVGVIWYYTRNNFVPKFISGSSTGTAAFRAAVLVLGLSVVYISLRKAGFGEALALARQSTSLAYGSMLEGSLGNFTEIVNAFRSNDSRQISEALSPFFESLVSATPFIFSGLSFAIAVKCGLFSIGTEGQIVIGAIFSVVAGYAITGLPAIIHVSLALVAGALGGALWGLIPAILKIKYGANEVINTIMMNYVAFFLIDWLLGGPIRRPDNTKPVSPFIAETAQLPSFFEYPSRLHLGFFIAIAVAVFLAWFLFRTSTGLEIRLVGKNPHAAKYAGINLAKSYIIAFCISGALGGLAGAVEVLGLNHYLSSVISPGFGFDGISLSILANNHPVGVIFTSLLFGTLRNGGTRMQNVARVPTEIISIVQSLVIAFMAAPALINMLFKLKAKDGEKMTLSRGWGK